MQHSHSNQNQQNTNNGDNLNKEGNQEYPDTNIQSQTLRLKIEGMSCASCSAAIERTLKKQDSIIKANVFLLSNSATVEFNPSKIDINTIIKIIHDIGYEAKSQEDAPIFQSPVKPQEFSLFKMQNQMPVIPNKISLKPTLQMKTNISTIPQTQKPSLQTAQVETKITQINNLLSQQNMQDSSRDKTIQQSPQNLFQRLSNFLRFFETKILNSKRRLLLSLICSFIVVYMSMLHDMFQAPLPYFLQDFRINASIQLFITLCVMHFGRTFYIRGLKALYHGIPNMDSLVAVGSLAGFLYSVYIFTLGFHTNQIEFLHQLYFEGVCVILSFIMLGKYIEESAKNKATKNAQNLLSHKAEKVYRILNPHTIQEKDSVLQVEEISPDFLVKGDYIRVLEHSFIPVDGIILSEQAQIDESMLSGESLPITKNQNDILHAGTLNLETTLIMRATSTTKDSTLAKIHSLIAQSYESKAKIAQLADKISGIFVPIVIALATLSGLFWFFYADLATAINFFASTLLISCPCALGLATPMAILFANARANKMGVFFKNAQSLENISKCDMIIFDKTGTLTNREFKIQKIETFLDSNDKNYCTQAEILRITASIENTSTHIIAQSVCKSTKDLPLYPIIQSQSILNQGMKASITKDSKNLDFILGNDSFMRSYPLKNVSQLDSQESSKEGIYIYLAQFNREEGLYILLGYILLEENLKEDSQNLIQSLQKMGFTCEILSGDNENNVAKIAKVLNINYHAQCTPQDKLNYIKQLQAQNHKVIMIGDGTNDAIAIAQANVSIVMASGSEMSLEYGDIIYFNQNLSHIADSITLGNSTLRNIKQNLGFAFLYNIICIPLAMGTLSGLGIVLNPMMASLAMSLSSISVVSNATRLYYTTLK
ncbi:copper-translocating P-type ATPase [Helicobacter didelphidarum]|uniref:Copper-transporting ATPase n=1 Tax=Helicobacter didelphidarum TaxID=2040648 RepID=A0A3D8IKL6_9HELI|nr:heavy metal translocating P-type ATPase [Helicobacter didelphidarum]RDU65887.1 copper-translocating P-type ATPase [Helicobacter didelphidarum]